jgi:hypothetical protein
MFGQLKKTIKVEEVQIKIENKFLFLNNYIICSFHFRKPHVIGQKVDMCRQD